MKKSTLKILREDNFITIKKSPDLFTCVTCVCVFACVVLLPICFKWILQEPLGIAFYVACVLFNIATYIALLLGKLVLDTQNREIHVYNPFLHRYAFGDIANIGIYHKSDYEGTEMNKVIINLNNGKKCSLRTTSKEQAEELAMLLRSEVYSKNEESNSRHAV
jgi:hypothetical protein